jgi:hypothetical protein
MTIKCGDQPPTETGTWLALQRGVACVGGVARRRRVRRHDARMDARVLLVAVTLAATGTARAAPGACSGPFDVWNVCREAKSSWGGLQDKVAMILDTGRTTVILRPP